MLHLPQAPNAPAAADIAQVGVFRNDFSIITKANSVLKGRRVGTGNSGSTRGNESQRVQDAADSCEFGSGFEHEWVL
jgi:hypothetical protein